MINTVLCLALILVFSYTIHADYFRCGDDNWLAYEDKKCVRLFQSFATRYQAAEICEQYGSTLVIIGSAAEQMFLTEYVFNTSDSNNVWIGAERRPDSTTNEFDWNDGSPVERFTNWEVGHPTSDVRRSCVHMHSQLSVQISDMQWVDIACTVGNWFICQKLQSWPLEHFQQTLLGLRSDLQHYVESFTNQMTDMTHQLDSTKTDLQRSDESFTNQIANLANQLGSTQTDLQRSDESFTNQIANLANQLGSTQTDLQRSDESFTNQIADLKNQLFFANYELKLLQDNPIPIGFIYVQLSNQPEPKTLWPTVEWSEITTEYAGLFFRAAGGGAASFGSIQAENSPRLTNANRFNRTWTNSNVVVTANGVASAVVSTGSEGGMYHWGLAFTVSSGEVRPRNSATRIWKRSK